MPINYEDYPPDWKTNIVPRILQRADNRCECCDLEQGQTVYAVTLKVQDDDLRYKPRVLWFSTKGDAWRTARFNEKAITLKTVCLAVAHLDHDEKNWDVTDDRLAALCQLCHIIHDARNRQQRSKF